MANITRTYRLVGPVNAGLAQFVGPTAAVLSFSADAVMSVQINNTADDIATLDEYMGLFGWAPGVPSAQRFIYTATGAEGVSFDIPLPVARTDTNYVAAVIAANQPNGIYVIEVPTSGYAINQVHVNTGVAPTAGDKFAVWIADLT